MPSKTLSQNNQPLSDLAEHYAVGILQEAQHGNANQHLAMLCFDVLSQWFFDDLCRHMQNDDLDDGQKLEAILAMDHEAQQHALRHIMSAMLLGAKSPMGLQAEQLQQRAMQFAYQVESTYPDGFNGFPDNLVHILTVLDQRWFNHCEQTEGIGIAEAKSDRLRRYIWKTLQLTHQSLKKLQSL